MKIHKMLAVLLAAALLLPQFLMAANLQKTYTTRDEVYVRVDELSRRAGVLGPSSFSPMSARALMIALERIDPEMLGVKDRSEYEELKSILEGRDLIYSSDNFGIGLAIGVNLSANIADYGKFMYFDETYKTDRREEVLIPSRYDMPFFSIYPQFYFGDNIFLESEFSIQNDSLKLYESSLGWLITKTEGTSSVLKFNVVQYQPYKAGLSIGNRYFSLIAGRYQHSIGSGITGNMVVGDNFIYQEVGMISFLSNHFSYNMSLTRFDQQEYTSSIPVDVLFSKQDFSGKQQMRSVHRMDMTFFNKLRFALDFGTLYNSSYGFDIRYFFPFVLQHNYYNYTNAVAKETFDEANNIMGVTLEFVPTPGITLMAQFVLDQYQLPGEDPDSVPIAYGAMANIKHSVRLKNGQLKSYAEAVYTNPFLYMNRKENSDGTIDVNLDYFVGYNYNNEYNFAGYAYGPDNIVFSLGSEYDSDGGLWSLGGRLLYKIHGGNRIKISSSGIDMGNIIFGHDPSSYMGVHTPSSGWDSAEHLVKVTGYGNFNLYDTGISFYAAAGANIYFNYDNVEGDKEFLPQATIGISWKGL